MGIPRAARFEPLTYEAMKILSAEFLKSCETPEQFPREPLPEVAFVGRSNVGKSSLLNSLLYRRRLAKISGTPGKTRCINYFRVTTGDPRLRSVYFVDLPGYGYAKVAKSERAQWGPMIQRYLTGRPQLCGVVLLIDSRGIELHDVSTYAWLEEIGQASVVVTTKADKLGHRERRASLEGIRDALELPPAGTLIAYSSATHEGRDELWRAIRDMVAKTSAGTRHEA